MCIYINTHIATKNYPLIIMTGEGLIALGYGWSGVSKIDHRKALNVKPPGWLTAFFSINLQTELKGMREGTNNLEGDVHKNV